MKIVQRFGPYFLLILLGVFAWITTIWGLSTSSNFQIANDVIGGGGIETAASTNFKLQSTIAETLINSATTTSANFGLKTGFRELYPDDFITFSVGATSIAFGDFDTGSTKTGSHTMNVETNASGGFSVTVSGATLTDGSNTVNAVGSTAVASSAGSEQFGINVVANTTPSVGANPSGTAPIGSAADQYNTADLFAYDDTGSQTVATSTNAINDTTYTVSYIANIAGGTDVGSYSTTLTYSATANF